MAKKRSYNSITISDTLEYIMDSPNFNTMLKTFDNMKFLLVGSIDTGVCHGPVTVLYK